LGLANYCREFVKGYAILAVPLFKLLRGEGKKNTKLIIFNENEIKAFKKLQKTFFENTERAQPNLTQTFILTTDASESVIGAILSQQKPNGKVVMISCFSKNLDSCQKNYCVTDKELLGLSKVWRTIDTTS
jgi:hypothetical protein